MVRSKKGQAFYVDYIFVSYIYGVAIFCLFKKTFLKLGVWLKKLYKVEISNSTYPGFNCLHKTWWQLSHWRDLTFLKLRCFWKSCLSLNRYLLNSAKVYFVSMNHWFHLDLKHWHRFSYVADAHLYEDTFYQLGTD